MANLADLAAHATCATCAMRPLCTPRAGRIDEPAPVECRVRLEPGARLYAAGSPANALFALRTGSLKLTRSDGVGGTHVVRFLIPGDVAGLDAFGGAHSSCAQALGDAEVCRFPAWRVELLAEYDGRTRVHLRRLLAEALAEAEGHAVALARLGAEQRVARFLLSLSQRWPARGYMAHAFPLPMQRREIGDHLGLTEETVSRLFSSFRARGFLRLRRRSVEILRPEGLRAILSKPRPSRRGA